MKPDIGSLIFVYGMFILIIVFILIGLMRWIFRINHIVDRLDIIIKHLEGGKGEDVPNRSPDVSKVQK